MKSGNLSHVLRREILGSCHRRKANMPNLKKCHSMKAICRKSHKVRKECPNTCIFMKAELAAAKNRVRLAKKALIKKREVKTKKLEKAKRETKKRTEESKIKNAFL